MAELPVRRSRRLSRPGLACVGVVALVPMAWAVMPALAQDPAYHLFADQRRWLGIPRAADVLSNIAFVLVGLAGIVRLASRRRMRFSSATEAGLWCVALGLIATGAGSAWFHLNPNDATLAWDRLAMTLVFAGMLGTAVAQRIGPKVARVSLVVLVLLGIASIAYWRLARHLSIYATFHAGAVVALLALLLAARRETIRSPGGGSSAGTCSPSSSRPRTWQSGRRRRVRLRATR